MASTIIPLKEMVANHSTEEVINWLSHSAEAVLNSADDMMSDTDTDSSYVLGVTLTNLVSLSKVLKELNKKLIKQDDGPVVA